MRYIDRFSGYLREYENKFPLPAIEKSIQHIKAVRKQIDQKLKDVTLGDPNPELVMQSIIKFFRWAENPSTEYFNWLEVAFLCRGLLKEIPGYGSLMESNSAIKVLLRKFSTQYQSHMLSAYPWQGLLNAYYNVTSRQNPSIEENLQELQAFLEKSLEQVAYQSSFKPRWLEALVLHRIVLTKNATQTLAEEALQGKTDRVESIRREVNIPNTSWFWRDLLISQVEAITAYPDEKFKLAIDQIFPQLQEREVCLDDGLSLILDRYALCSIREPHHEIKSTVISRWKSPAMEKQQDWERVSLEAKRMVQRWLAQEDIEDIFGKLVKDNRRYEFWLQFLDQIEYTFVWLGKEARQHQFLHNRRDRCADLKHSAKPDNNVILMKICDVFIIESGARAGGKCWAYRAEKIIPLLHRGGLSYDVFRDPKHNLFNASWGGGDGLIHTSVNWESAFISELSRLNIKPDEMTFDEIINRYKLRYTKLPSGTEKIGHDYRVGTLSELLRQSNFSYSTDGYYRNPRHPI